MSGNQSKNKFNNETEVHITYEDQQKINRFARLNAKYEDFKEEIQGRKNELQNLEDAISELMLSDDTEQVMYQEGEIFLHKDVASARNSLEEYKNVLLQRASNIEREIISLKEQIDELKAHLYAKFGNHIHLEMEE